MSQRITVEGPGRFLGAPRAGEAYLSTADFAKAVQISHRTVMKYVKDGRLDYCLFGSRYFVPEREVRRWHETVDRDRESTVS